MKSTHRFQVKASIESIYDNVLSAERWLSFVPGYQGLESGNPNWPNEGSSIVIRFRFGPWSAHFKVTMVMHEYGRRFSPHEEAFSGLYIDNVEVNFQAEDGMTEITLIRDVTSRSILVRVLLLLMYPFRWVTARRTRRRINAMVEASSIKNGVGPA